MSTHYKAVQITTDQAGQIAQKLYRIKATAIALPGEVDFNFRLKAEQKSYILKVSRPGADLEYIDFQQKILQHVAKNADGIESPTVLPNKNGAYLSEFTDKSGNLRKVRLLSWTEGRLWSQVNPQTHALLFNLGSENAKVTSALTNFKHQLAHRNFEWDTAQAIWTTDYLHLFNEQQKVIISYFQQGFTEKQALYATLRKAVVHNDANDYNVVVSEDLQNPTVKSIIDYGDAVYTQTINDLAITIAYAIMHKPDPLNAALQVISGYHSIFALQPKELEMLYNLVAMRLVISLTKSAINKQKEPENEYLLISEKPAWELLEKWYSINENLAYYSFRKVCGYPAQPNQNAFVTWAKASSIKLTSLFPSLNANEVLPVDMSVSSTWLGNEDEYSDFDLTQYKLKQLAKTKPNAIIAGGYTEIRPFYSTNAYRKEGHSGPEYRTAHLGVDFWLAPQTPIHAICDATVHSIHNNNADKDYGPCLILEHKTETLTFYTLYGHLTQSSLSLLCKGDSVKKGDLIAYLGQTNENGNWVAHLHFQVILDMLHYKHDFPGVAFPNELEVWSSICPDPNLIFKQNGLNLAPKKQLNEIVDYRKQHLGKSLSLSYSQPLNMVRGMGAFLIDTTGRKYLDTANNVAHVGHEHPRVVKAASGQIAILNTNTRYLHENINAFAEALLSTFPDELSVVHFVNSGSEANELAMRMARTATGERDFIAAEIGYHGNTSGCIDVSSYKFDGKGGKGTPEHTHIVPLPDAYRGVYTGKNTGKKYAAHIQQQIERVQEKGRNVAGFICESIISCGGQIELPKNYLETAYRAVRGAGGLCISDEVQVGCGRTGSHFWGFQPHNVVPDIVTIGKPIGNGHPLAAVVCTSKVASAFANGMEYFNTFGGNPVSCAIGTEVLRVIKDEKLQENALSVGNFLKEGLTELQKQYPIIGNVRGQGLFLGFELVNDKMQPLAGKATYLANRMRDFAILMSTDGKDNNVLKIKPPMVFSTEDAVELLLRLKTVFAENFMTDNL